MSTCSADSGSGQLPDRAVGRRDVMTHDAPETIRVTTRHVSCDGGGGAHGHPLVYYRIPDEIGWVECGYCDRRFVLDDGAQPRQDAASGSPTPGETSDPPPPAEAKD